MLFYQKTLVLLLLIVPVCLQAQTEEPEKLQEVIELEQIGQYDMNANEDLIQGRRELPDPSVTGQILSAGNQAVIIQHGDENSATLRQEGDRNHFGLYQYGMGNDYEGAMVGENNLIRVLQFGESNFVSQDLGGNDMRLQIIQEGNNHEVYQVETDGSAPAYQIHQTGEAGMKIIVEHQKVIP